MTKAQLIKLLQETRSNDDASVEIALTPENNLDDNSWWDIKAVEPWENDSTGPILLRLGQNTMG